MLYEVITRKRPHKFLNQEFLKSETGRPPVENAELYTSIRVGQQYFPIIFRVSNHMKIIFFFKAPQA